MSLIAGRARKRLGWGVVGTGRIADTEIAPAIARLPSTELVAVASRDGDRARTFAEKHGARVGYAGYEALLADDDVQAVMIATPNALHAEQVIAAARAGKHVLCDKPLATSVEDALRVLEAADSSGITLGINFQTRHFTAFLEAREAIRSGSIGEVLVVQMEMSSGDTPLSSWRADPALAGLGCIYNIGVHGYDLLRFLLGDEAAEVTALTDTGREDRLERLALTLIRFEHGPIAYVNANQVAPFHRPNIAVYGTRGRITGVAVTRPQQAASGELRILVDGKETVSRHDNMDAYVRVIEDFTRAVIEGRPPRASGLDGLRSVELTQAIARAARSGTTVRVERAPAPDFPTRVEES